MLNEVKKTVNSLKIEESSSITQYNSLDIKVSFPVSQKEDKSPTPESCCSSGVSSVSSIHVFLVGIRSNQEKHGIAVNCFYLPVLKQPVA